MRQMMADTKSTNRRDFLVKSVTALSIIYVVPDIFPMAIGNISGTTYMIDNAVTDFTKKSRLFVLLVSAIICLIKVFY